MTVFTHAITVNGSRHYSVGEGEEDGIRRPLERLDGADRYSLILWRIPPGQHFDEVDKKLYPQEYIQCAGSYPGPMVCEVRELAPGGPVQSVVGRALPGIPGDAWVTIPWDKFETRVLEREALAGDEVWACFREYFRTGRLPPGYSRRAIAL
jgi:hypothetical protein